MEVAVSTNCMQLWWNKTLFTNDTLELAELMPGCKYTFNYRALCFASREDNNGISETVVSDFCTGMYKRCKKCMPKVSRRPELNLNFGCKIQRNICKKYSVLSNLRKIRYRHFWTPGRFGMFGLEYSVCLVFNRCFSEYNN